MRRSQVFWRAMATGLAVCTMAGCPPRPPATTLPDMGSDGQGQVATSHGGTDQTRRHGDETMERSKIDKLIDAYANMGYGDARQFMDLFWLDDPNLTIVENDRPTRMGAEYIRFLADLIRRRGKQPVNQVFSDTQIYFIHDDVAYSVSLREELNVHKISRVTFVFQKKMGEWRIIHGHFSDVPE